MKRSHFIISCLILMVIVSCTKPYAPKVTTMPSNYLVVEGVINTGSNDSTAIKLSRTVPIESAAGVVPEHGAKVFIQDNQNQTYNLSETTTGLYVTGELNLDTTRQYRLNVTTADGKNYVSDYIAPEVNPPIDSIGYTLENNGLQVYVNTHNPQNSTHYYRWDYTETWHFHAKYESDWITNGVDSCIMRTPSQYIYYCWTNDLSNDIILGSSAKLSQDVIYQSPITFIEATSEKVETRYSILLKQYALNTAGYNYYSELKQNTEELGGIFDPQPVTGLTGNMHCTTNPAIPVIGYITAGTIQQKRVYIDNLQLPSYFTPIYPYTCEQDTALYNAPPKGVNQVLAYLVFSPANIVSQALFHQGAMLPYGFLFTDRECADCTIRGTTVQPSFWVNNKYGL